METNLKNDNTPHLKKQLNRLGEIINVLHLFRTKRISKKEYLDRIKEI